jgi:integrase
MALTDIELGKKAKDGTLTLGEAWDFAMSKADEKQKKRINPIKSGAKTLGIDLSTPYKDLKQADVIKLFTVEGSPDAKNRAYNLQTLEALVRPVMERYGATAAMETVAEGVDEIMYPQLAGAKGLAGTQRTGLAGERPMQGLLPKEELDKIYAEATPLVAAEYGQPTSDLLEYHKATANRPEQLLGLKKSDVTIVGDTITVKGKVTTKKDHKGRPELSFDTNSRLGRLLKQNYDTSTSDYLFDVTDGDFTDAFNKHIGTRLQPFANILPAKEIKSRSPAGELVRNYEPVTTPSVIRSIVPRFMLEQYNVNENFVEGMMGHVNPSILKKNYAGFVPQKDLPALIESPVDFAGGEFGTTQTGRVNLDLLTDEQKEALASEQQTTILAEERAKQSQAAAATAEAEAKRTSTLAAITPEQIQEAEDKSRAIEEAKIKGRQAAKLASADADVVPESNPEARANLERKGFDAKSMADGINKYLGKVPGPVKKALGPLGLGLTAATAASTATEVEAATDSPALAAIAGASEFGPIGYSDVRDIAAGRSEPDTFGTTPASRIAAEEQAGFIDLGRDRGPEAAPAIEQDQGFLTR